MSSGALPPWHVWGNSQNLSFSGGRAVTGQLARINYRRPETWRFLFELTLLSHLEVGQFVQANFIVATGIGRVPVTLNPFATLMIRGLADSGAQTWRTSVMQPVTDVDPDNPERIPTDILIGQDIQCDVQLFGTADLNINARVTAMFAPNVHVRPDWYTDHRGDGGRFLGEEKGGT